MDALKDFITWIDNKAVVSAVVLLAFVGGILVLSIILAVCIPYLRRRLRVPQVVKKNSAAIIGAVVIFILILPIILWSFGLYGIKLFANSDALGYYGALIGGGVTVLGVYWTLKHESENSKEERRKNSLPILRFNFSPEHINYDKSTLTECKTDKDGNSFSGYDIVIDTTVVRRRKGFREYSNQSFIEYGKLNIENIGLGVAVFSTIDLFRGNKCIVCQNLNPRGLERFLVVPGEEISLNMFIKSDDFDEEDELFFYFTDLYLNEYCYIIPFENMRKKSSYYKTTIEPNTIDPIPELNLRISERLRRRRRRTNM